ncbi:transcription factor IIIb subunit, putative [Theileria equi strain WA]|uniref:B-related factor 1 n=1 Tax=Theileria equi strain WA TaxID=1537102 RepID=L1LCJ0_THEEQ|nr:transcription factor IIIb subunit, putative [Theileria equi strain WA]EKX72873.1 transcription factor IIIb subunit, putative [Theileria equi strain WA]|eukprot:XP_004832325.1 transcription factor IIIb subunit, putative [Theileria equi strain WA]
MVLKSCTYCGSQDLESVKHLGELVCQDCGAVLQENTVLEDLQYSENRLGSSTLVGQFIPVSGIRPGTLSSGSLPSRDHVLKRGCDNIERIALRLNLSPEHINKAQAIYKLAVQRNFTMGRNNLHVASCCLYTVCRREKTPHLLIDFSDILQTPVKTIGQIFMKLVRMLHISVPNVDPSIFFERFASKLYLKDNIQKVISTGVRIIQAMNRDWLCTGRRPTGLCGAALVVAARFHGISLPAEDVAAVVRISHPTIMKRLSEFKDTCAAHLKCSEFEKVDLDTLPNIKLPPCLISKYAAKERKYAKSLDGRSDVSTTDTAEYDLRGKDYAETDSTYSDFDRQSDPCLSENSPILGPINVNIPTDVLCNDQPTAAQINNIAQSILENFKVNQPSIGGLCKFNETESCEDSELSSDDEEDIQVFAEMILPESEKESKTKLWDEITKDIMQKVMRRQKERKKREESGQAIKKRKYTRRKYMDYPEANNAAESTKMALERRAKGFISHINTNAFNALLSQS